MIKTREGFCVVAALAIAAGACSKSKAGGRDPAGGGGGAPMGMPVEVVVARTDTVRDEISATGQIEAVQSIDLRPEVDGRVVEILIREGQEVAQGQYDLQRIRLERTTVRAPFAGVVGQRYVSLGDYVTNSTKLASLHTVNPQRAAFQVPERFAHELRPGQRVSFRVAAIAGRDFTGEVDFVDPVVQLPGRTILVKAQVPNPARLLQPGMFIEARLVTAVRPQAVVVPEDAVVPAEGSSFVWVVVAGKADRRKVNLGVRTPGFVEITDGVKAGDQVVTGGLAMLAPGAPVMPRVVERKPPTATSER